MKTEMEKFRGKLFIATIYKKFRVFYVLSDKKEFFKVYQSEVKKIPTKKVVPRNPCNDLGYENVEIEDGQKISFEALKVPKGKHRWAREIKLIGLGELF